MSTVVKDLGAVSAYAYAVEKGYTGTEAEFAELMADYAEVGQRAEDAADSALESKTAAQTAATTATNKATEATTAATTATNKAAEAQADADAAALDASQAMSAASTATTKASEASQSATTATNAKNDAVTAKTAAQAAQTAAETAEDNAETSASAAAASAASVAESAAQIQTNAEDISQLKSELTAVDEELTLISGVVLPPPYAIGARYVSNGVDTWTNNTIRMSFAKGTYAKLKQGDVVTRNTTAISYFIGGYSTDGGSTFTAISGTYNSYTVPADGLYFFCLVKQSDATFTDNDLENAWSYLKITRSNNSMEDRLASVEETSEATASETADIKDAIDYEVAPITPTEYYEMPYSNTDINYNGIDVENTNTEASGYIPIDSDFYDVCVVVSSTSVKYGLGGIFYYNANKAFQLRVLPGTSYEFSTFNGENVIWLNIVKDNPNYKYVRFVEANNRNYKYWIVEKGAKAKVLDEYGQLPFIGKTIVNFGDSIFGQTRPPKDVSSYLAIKTGATVLNAGFGGCEMSRHAIDNYDPFSMYRLADAIATGTWTLQETAASASGMPAYFAETVSALKALDFTTVDIITISYGTNDWNNSSPLDNGGKADMAYFADALRYSIETLLTAFPNLRIFVCTPTYRFWMNEQGQFTEDSNTKVNQTTNTKLTDFVEKTIAVAKEYQLPYINDYDIGMNRYNRSYYFYPTDGTHPRPTGNQLIADNIANKIY